MKNNKTLELIFTIAKPILAVIGFLSILFSFVTIKGEILIDFGTFSVFKLLSSMNTLEELFLSSDDVSLVKKSTLIAVAVAFVFALTTVLTSLVKGKNKSIISIISSALNIVFSIFVIWFIPNSTKDDWLDISVCRAGSGYYVSIVASIIVIIVGIVELTVMSNKNEKIKTNNQFVQNVPNAAVATPKEDKPTMAYSQTIDGHITAIKGEYQGYQFPIGNGEILLIGRDPSKCQIVLTQSAQYVSGVHCSVKFENGTYYVCDYSKNGVLINNNRIPQQQWVCFPQNSVISLANDQIKFELC